MISLRATLNSMGIDGHECEKLINEYWELVKMAPYVTMNLFIQQVKDSRK